MVRLRSREAEFPRLRPAEDDGSPLLPRQAMQVRGVQPGYFARAAGGSSKAAPHSWHTNGVDVTGASVRGGGRCLTREAVAPQAGAV